MDGIKIFAFHVLIVKYFVISSDIYRCPSFLPRDRFLKTFRDQCYYFVYQETYWSSARDDCYMNRGGGRHVVIPDQATQNFVYSSLLQLGWDKNGIWIGAHDLDAEGDWKWVTGQRLTYVNWDDDQPGGCFLVFCHEDCANLRLINGKWHDYPCDSLEYVYTYICQYPMGPATTTTTTTTTTRKTTPTTTTSTTATTKLIPTTTSSVFKTTTLSTVMKTSRYTSNHTAPVYSSYKPTLTAKTDAKTTEVYPSTSKYPVTGTAEKQISLIESGAIITVVATIILLLLLVFGTIFVITRQQRRRLNEKKNLRMTYDNATYAVHIQALPRTHDLSTKITNMEMNGRWPYLNGNPSISDKSNMETSGERLEKVDNACNTMLNRKINNFSGECLGAYGTDTKNYCSVEDTPVYEVVKDYNDSEHYSTLAPEDISKAPRSYSNNVYTGDSEA